MSGLFAEDVRVYVSSSIFEEHGETEIELTIAYFSIDGLPSITINSIESISSGVSVKQVDPTLPQTTLANGHTKHFIVTNSAPPRRKERIPLFDYTT